MVGGYLRPGGFVPIDLSASWEALAKSPSKWPASPLLEKINCGNHYLIVI
jgi:hypothetical protein